MSPVLEAYVDAGSPNVYLAIKALGPILERTGAQLVLKPALLGGIFKATGNIAPFFTYQKVKGRLDYERLEIERFTRQHGLHRFRWTSHFPPNTVLTMRAAVAAERSGEVARFMEAALCAIWEQDVDLSDETALTRILTDAGLDAEALIESARSEDTKKALFDRTQQAVDRGVFGMPTFFVGPEMFFGKDRLAQVEDALLKAS